MRFDTEKFTYDILKTLVGVNVSAEYDNVFSSFPAVYYKELDQHDILSGDNFGIGVVSSFDIQCFVDNSTSAHTLAGLVNTLLSNNMYNLTYSENIPDTEGKFQRRVMRYTRIFTQADF